MQLPLFTRAALSTSAALLLTTLVGCSWMPFQKKAEADPAPLASTHAAHSPTPAQPRDAKSAPPIAVPIPASDVQGLWECQFQAKVGEDSASFTYTNQFHADGTLKSQAYLEYELTATQQKYRFVVQGNGHWRLQGNTITLIVPDVVKQDRSGTKHPDLLNDKDLVPEDLSDTWAVQATQGKNMRVTAGSLGDDMLCSKE